MAYAQCRNLVCATARGEMALLRQLRLPLMASALRFSARLSVEAAEKVNSSREGSPRWKTEKEDMLAVMEENKQFNSSTRNAFRNAPPRMMGLCKSEWLRKAEILRAAGMREDEAQLTAFRLPSALDIQENRIRELLAIFKKYGLNLRRMVHNAPLVAALDPRQVSENLAQLGEIGMSSSQIRLFLYSAPIALGLPLSEWTIRRAEQLKERGYANATVGEALSKGLRLRSYASAMDIDEEKGEDEVSCFLYDLGVPVDRILSKCPSFFNEDVDHIREMCDILCGPPLFCPTEGLSKILQQAPYLFPLWKEQYLLDQLVDLMKIIKTAETVLNRFLYSTATVLDVLKPPTTIKERLEVMKKYGMTRNDQYKILWARSMYFSLELTDVDRRLEAILGHGDITIQMFLEKPGETAVMGYHRLIARLDFGRSIDAKKLADLGMAKLCHGRDGTFASYFGKSLEEYLDFLRKDNKYLSPSVLRTRIRRR